VIDSLQESVELDYRANVGVKSPSHLKREKRSYQLTPEPLNSEEKVFIRFILLPGLICPSWQ
jgi:hypothetical protein